MAIEMSRDAINERNIILNDGDCSDDLFNDIEESDII